MTIKELMENKLYDEDEQIVILFGDVNCPNRPYTGRLSEIPNELHDKNIESISAMGELRRNRWHLNQYGWTEIWIEEEQFIDRLQVQWEDWRIKMKDVTIISVEEKEDLVKNASLAMAAMNMIMSKIDRVDGNNIIIDRNEWNSLAWSVKKLSEIILEPEESIQILSFLCFQR